MAQRVEYEPIPGTRYDQYIFKLRLVLTAVQQPGGNKFKAFRDFLRKQNMWDKDKTPILLSLIELSYDKTNVKSGKTTKRLLNANSDTDFQSVLFERLRELNILLVKYVLEALDVQQGGRLHSVHELYRMITSYVYPGTYIALTAFQAWIEWMAATGYIKLIGIRWALSDKGQKVVSELRALDVDEILEDMADEEAGDGEPDADADDDEDAGDADDAPVPAASPARPTDLAAAMSRAPATIGSAKAKPIAADVDDEEDLFDDLPPEPELPDAGAVAEAAKRMGIDEDETAPPPPPKLVRAPPVAIGGARAAKAGATGGAVAGAVVVAGAVAGAVHAPMAGAGYAVVPVSGLASAETEAVRAQVVAWYAALGEWPELTAPALGVAHDPTAGDRAILVELGVLAVLVEGLAAQPQVFAFVKRLRETTFFASLGGGEGAEEALDAVEKLGAEPWARALFERLVHARFVARRASNKIDLLYQVRNAESGREAVEALREHLTGASFVEAPFWVLRELVRLGVVPAHKNAPCVVVPTRRLVANAARIGLTGVTELRDGASLVALSESATRLFGTREAGFGAALERLDEALGLSTQ